MPRSPTASSNLVDQVIARKPTRNALEAVEALRNTVASNVFNRFHYEAPESSFIYVVACEVVGGFLSLVAMVASAGASAAFLSLAIAPAFFAFLYQGAPNRQLAHACKKVLASASKVPEASQKHLREFTKTAKRLFLYARVAVAQQAVASAVDRPAWRVRQLERKGLRLVERTATKLQLTTLERGELRAAFKAGQLPRPEAYTQALDKHMERVTSALRGP
jgi:hypothetical protein